MSQYSKKGSCPICGIIVEDSEQLVAGHPRQHRCKQKTLNCIDAAHQKDDSEPHPRSLQMTQWERYKEGFGLFGRKKEDNLYKK